ncbi:MAG: isoprenylcysteine carboxylmethyltransferase family protein [Deltaproteobacteria bacterium]|nr:isoprenylcysteine carboxylmethyltransferase family protein [Deltaproteobacteria bacterium]
MNAAWVETAFVLLLFGGYLGLWRLKRMRQRRSTGVDPEVLGKTGDPVQTFFAHAARGLTVLVVVVIAVHAVGFELSPWLARDARIDRRLLDYVGLATGLFGLTLCWIAQSTMGNAWRVGIDDKPGPGLVRTGIYSRVRNPTYLGLYLVNGGLFLIWPTPAVLAFAIAFYLLMEFQVRCEEAQLIVWFGDDYRQYLAKTWRYVPWLY